ncbi:hypothetical protein PSHT_01210, partial [Puccinia striiformis]
YHPATQSWEITTQKENRVLKGQKESTPQVTRTVIPDHKDPHLAIPEHHHKPGKIETPRYVSAHVVQGNFQFHEAKDWSADMRLNQQMGTDAFAINIGQDLTNEKQLPLIYEIVKQSSFHIFLSFDMQFCLRKAQFIYRGKPLVSTFSGEVPRNFLVSSQLFHLYLELLFNYSTLNSFTLIQDNIPDFNTAWSCLKEKLNFPELRQLCLRKLAKEGKESPKLKVSAESIQMISPLADGMLSWAAWCPVLLSQDHRYKDNLAAVGKQYAAPLSTMFYKHLSDCQYGRITLPSRPKAVGKSTSG